MKYSAEYSNQIDLSNFDELIIKYDKQDRELLTFLGAHQDQTIILSIDNIFDFVKDQEWNKLNAIYEKHSNFKIRFFSLRVFSEIHDEGFLEALTHLNMPYFFGFLITTFDQLHYLFTLNPCEVYLAEDICFSLTDAKKLCSAHNMLIRAFPNIAQCSIRNSPAVKKFFIRPEDLKEYEDVIDTIQFWGPEDRQHILYKIYNKGIWFGELQELILDFNISFDSTRIIPAFAQSRKNCGRKCMKGHSCMICDRIYNISKLLEQRHLIVKTNQTH